MKVVTDSQTDRVHICAWCKNLIIDGRRIDANSIPFDSIDSHGICLICAAEVEALYCSEDREM